MTSQPLHIVTPEHVEIRLLPAGLGSRFLALSVDAILTTGLALLILRLVGPLLPAGIAIAVYITLNFIITWSYHVYFETRHGGQSPGKRVTRIRVVDARGLPITVQQSVVRNAVRMLDGIPIFYGVGAAVSLLHPWSRRLGDIAADTLVIEESVPLEYHGELAKARHFNSLRTPSMLRLIRNRIGLEEREFLLTLCLRADALEPGARVDLMDEVAAHYREELGIEDPNLSGENLVLDLTTILFSRK